MLIILNVGAETNQITYLGSFKISEDVNLKQICGNSTQSCSSCNITSISHPFNSTNLIEDVAMTKRGADFNYTLDYSFTNTVATYIVNGFCIAGDEYVVWGYTFDITKTGFIQDTSDAIFYLILGSGVFIIFLISLYFNLSIPYGNPTNEDNAIIQVSKVKYLKLMLTLITYPLFLWLINILLGISENFVTLSMYSGFFGFLFYLLVRLSLPLVIFIIVVTFFNIIKDLHLNNMIKKFGKA